MLYRADPLYHGNLLCSFLLFLSSSLETSARSDALGTGTSYALRGPLFKYESCNFVIFYIRIFVFIFYFICDSHSDKPENRRRPVWTGRYEIYVQQL